MEKINSYYAIDIETTGLDPKRDKMIEIGAICVQDGVTTQEFETFVNPGRQLSEHIVTLTGISEDMVEYAPEAGAAVKQLLEFCDERTLPILGHHVIFDFSFIKRAAVNHHLEFERNGIDTLKLCRHFMPETERKNLESACAFYGVERTGAHRALADARDAHRLYQAIMLRHQTEPQEEFTPFPLIYKVKREQPASKKQKEDLRYLIKYHKIDLPVQIDCLSRNEISRITDKIILQYGRI